MKEYIERAEAINAIRQYQYPYGVEFLIANIPAADVAPVRHGRWEPGNPICPVCGENKFKDLDADVWADWQPKFCPNCGARMGKEEQS